MGKVRKENGVLKLVRPGGIVELYTHPIKAAQIMERHPRHFVTRPDVFKFPYIVVKPESILKPGRVFFIVPYHTINRLLQSKGYRGHCKYIPDHYEAVDKQALEYAQPMIDDRRLVSQFLNKNLHQIKDINTSFFHQIIPVGNFQNKKQSDHKLKAIPRDQQIASLYLAKNKVNSIYKDGGYDSDGSFVPSAPARCFLSRRKGGESVEMSTDSASTMVSTTGLKPCLRKHQTNRTQSLQGPRLRFMLPDEDGDDDENWDTDFSYF